MNLDLADDQELLATVLGYYHQTLLTHEAALSFLRDHGITREALECFRVGYADRSLGTHVPIKQLKAGQRVRLHLQAVGLYRANGREHLRGCLTFPIPAALGTGQIVDIYGYKFGERLRAGTQRDEYLTLERRGVWNVEAFGATEEVVLCSNIFDALALWSHGYRNVTGLFDSLTPDHLAALAEFKIRRVLLLDETLAESLMQAGLDCFHVRLPHGVGLWDYAKECPDPGDALGALLRKSSWLGKGQAPSVGATCVASNPPTPGTPTCETAPPVEAIETLAPVMPRIATPVPPLPEPDLADVSDDEMVMTFGDRRYRVRGWTKNLAFDVLRVNILASNEQGLFVDTFDLYSAKHRRGFTIQAAQELGVQENVVKKDLGRVLLKLEELQDQRVTEALKPKTNMPDMTEAERDEAMKFLRDPNLLDRIANDFDIIGESANKLVGYLAAISRKLDEPLAIVIQSSSAAGKSTLMDAILDFVPDEDVIKYSAMTGQSLYYMSDGSLKHKILALVEEEGASRASYALKLLQSEQELRIASTGKEAKSGRLTTQEYRVEGPVMLCLTTTAITLDEELLNRCVVLTVGEEREQTRAIHVLQRQRQTLEGILRRRDRDAVIARHRNAQRLLRPIFVVNPFANELTFRDDQIRARRDHVKYLTLIRAVALLHQHQRPTKTVERDGHTIEYIEVVPDDIVIANRLMLDILGQSMDELPPQTRRLLEAIRVMVVEAGQRLGMDQSDYRFSRRDVRDHTHLGHSQLAIHLRRLEQMEYLLVHHGGRGRSFEYELLYDGNDRDRWLPGLLNPGTFRPTSVDVPGTVRATENGATANGHEASVETSAIRSESRVVGRELVSS